MSKYTILVHTSVYRGDHAADVVLSMVPIEGETVQELVDRLLKPDPNNCSGDGATKIELLRIVGGDDA